MSSSPARPGSASGSQRDLETAALHAQALHGLGDGLRQAGRRLLARLAERPGFLHVGLLRGLLGVLQRLEVALRVERLQLGLPAGQQGRQLGRRALVAAGERHPQAHALVQFGEPLRVGVGLAQVAVQRVRGVGGLRHARGQHLAQASGTRARCARSSAAA